MKRKDVKKNPLYPVIIILLFTAVIVFLYGVLASPLFIKLESQDLRRAFKEISVMNLSLIDEEDEEMLQSFQAEGLEFLITDKEFALVYTGGMMDAEGKIERYIKGHLDQFREDVVVSVRSYNGSGIQVIRLRTILSQGDNTYYIYIRREIQGTMKFVRYTVVYFCLIGVIFLILCYRVMRKTIIELQNAAGQNTASVDQLSQNQIMQAQKEFVANISHELKTPLAVISGQVEMLQNMGNEIDREYYFASIREEIEKMSDMVGDLLDLTVLEHHMEEMKMCMVDLSDMMEYMLLKYDALFKKNKIKVHAQIAKNCKAYGNRMYLEQAVNNYIMNAFAHTAQGKCIEISLIVKDSDARISVFNQGETILKEDMEHIWQSYYMSARENRQSANQMSNAGLGLYIVKKIVDQHGGTCGVENKEKGVEFWIRIPLTK